MVDEYGLDRPNEFRVKIASHPIEDNANERYPLSFYFRGRERFKDFCDKYADDGELPEGHTQCSAGYYAMIYANLKYNNNVKSTLALKMLEGANRYENEQERKIKALEDEIVELKNEKFIAERGDVCRLCAKIIEGALDEGNMHLMCNDPECNSLYGISLVSDDTPDGARWKDWFEGDR